MTIMARFRFRLETVLKQRQVVEDECQRELAKVMRFKMILMDQLKQMQQTISQSKRDLAGGLVGRVDLDRVGQFARYAGQSVVRAQEIVQRLAVLERQVAAARQKLLQATAARKAMELLRDRHRQEWIHQENRRETAEIDDLAGRAYLRQLAVGVEN